MATFTVYKTESCPYCQHAKQFLEALRKERPDIDVRYVDANAAPDRFRAIVRAVGRNTVPQIFIDEQYVGGWSELASAAGSGRLDEYLATGAWERPKKRRWWQRA